MNRRDFIYLKQLGWRLLLALLLFSLARIVFYTLNITHFPPVSITTLSAMLLTGIRFDVAALMYINSLLIVSYLMPLPQRANSGYRRFQAILFFVTNLPVLFLELTDSYYFRFAFRRMISSDLTLLLNSKHLIPNFLRDYWFIGFGVIALIAVTVYLYKKTSISVVRIPFSWQQTLLCCIGIALMILGARGGFQLRPIMNITAVQYVPDTRLAPVVANTTLSLLFSLQQRQLKELHYFRDAQLDLQYDICHRPQPTQPFRPLNVVVIALESFGNEYVGFFNPKSKNTPFFDSLLAMGLCSKNSYANGLRSTQGIVAITLGVPSLMDDPLMFSAYQSNSIHGLAFYLQQKGYSTTFYHGANEGSMEFERFALASGFQQYYDRRHYPV
ncbi:MAG: sulfatase-like hydrolase/transferase, partial [Saprospiraceae bacterium]